MNKLSKASFGATPDSFTSALNRAVFTKKARTAQGRRRTAPVLFAALLAVVLAGTALAVGLTWSPDAGAVRTAKAKLIEQYGLSQEAFGVLGQSATEEGGVWTVRFTPQNLNMEAIGEYTVTIEKGKAAAVWTHDDADPATYADGNLDADVWGAKQIDMGLAVHRAQNVARDAIDWSGSEKWTLEQRAQADEAILKAIGQDALPFSQNVAPTAEDIQEDDAIRLAREAVTAKYGVAAETMAAYSAVGVTFTKYNSMPEKEYRIYLKPPTRDDGTARSAEYSVAILSPSGAVEHCWFYGMADGRTLPEGPLAGYGDAVKEFIEEGAFELLSAEAKAEAAARIADAGFGDLLGGKQYIAPAASAIAENDAIEKARQALLGTYGFTEETLALLHPIASYQQGEAGDQWVVDFTADEAAVPRLVHSLAPGEEPRDATWMSDAMGAYRVALDAETGSVAETAWSLSELRGDKAYTEQTWGQAPAIDADMLPWLVSLLNAREEVMAKYEQQGYLPYDATLEDTAAHDQLLRDAGFDSYIYHNALPGPNDLTQEKALEIAKQAISEEYGVDIARLENAAYSTVSFYLLDGPQWGFSFFLNEDGEELDYGIRLDAKTGEVVFINLITGTNG